MSETKTFFENPMVGNSGWGAGVGGLIGAAIGSNGGFLGGNREPAVTPDQLQATVNGLQGQMSTDALQAQLGRIQGQIAGTAADSTISLGAAITSVKDAVVCGTAQTNLALCNLGHTVQSGFADMSKTFLQQALDSERARATELRIALSEQKNSAGHTATQVLLSQVVNSGN